jgi:hypothetical protein
VNLISLDRTKGVSWSSDKSLGWRTRCWWSKIFRRLKKLPQSLHHGSDGYQVVCPWIGLTKKARSCKCNENTNKNEKAAIWILLKLGSHKPMNGETMSTVWSKQNPPLQLMAAAEVYRVEGVHNPNDASLMDSTQYNAQCPNTVSQHRNSFWTLTCFDESLWLRSHLKVRPVVLERSHRYLTIHIKNIKIWFRTRLGLQFEGALVLESE